MQVEFAASAGNASDEQTVAGLRAGDERTFRELFARTYPTMKRVARGYVGSDAVAEEIVQETWTAVVTGIDRFQSRSRLGTWIFSILTNQAKTHCARERRALPFSAIAAVDADEPVLDPDRFQKDDEAWPGHWATPPRPWQKPERRLLALEARKLLKDALAQLPERQRMIVGLRDIDGHSAEEVCALLDLSQENQRVLLHRGRSRLRAELESYLDDARAFAAGPPGDSLGNTAGDSGRGAAREEWLADRLGLRVDQATTKRSER